MRSKFDMLREILGNDFHAAQVDQIFGDYGLSLEPANGHTTSSGIRIAMMAEEEGGAQPQILEKALQTLAEAKLAVVEDHNQCATRTATALLIDRELERQDKMWGENNERADIAQFQLLEAAMAQLDALWGRDRQGDTRAFDETPSIYPEDWSGFRDYGSGIANLVVAVAFLTNEIRRRMRNGESTERKSRDPAAQPYSETTQPNVLLP
jgi:hypothetical protein